ncbi:MAG: EAL domain-containing protein, partial [Arenicellales bacterium]
LKKLPLDRIKIDQSFTRDVVVDPNDAVIVETIVSMAKNLGLEVIAEGVESVAVFDALKSRSCLVFQGHYFSRPVGEGRLLDILRNGLTDPRDNVRSIGRSRRNAV